MKPQRADNLKPDQALDPVNHDRSAEQDELNFDNADEPSFQDLAPDYEFELLDEESNSETVDNNGTDDDLTPENLSRKMVPDRHTNQVAQYLRTKV